MAEHGSTVKKGDVLVELDTEKLDQALRDLETEQRLSELSIQQADAELPVLEKLMPLELAEAERLKKQAAEDQERFLKIDKMSTAYGTDDKLPRSYRFGYGVLDENLNGVVDPGEKRVYFEISDYATNYVFFESPH